MSKTIQQLAAETAAEIERRGLTKGSLVGYDYEYDYEDDDGFVADLDTCRVCLLGAAAAAYYGDPRRGYDEDGNGYDTFIKAIADKIRPGWQDEIYMSFYYGSERPVFDGAQEVVHGWNDDEPRTQAEVVGMLREMAADE